MRESSTLGSVRAKPNGLATRPWHLVLSNRVQAGNQEKEDATVDKHSVTRSEVQQIIWETLEGFVRREVQGLVQTMLAEQVPELLRVGSRLRYRDLKDRG